MAVFKLIGEFESDQASLDTALEKIILQEKTDKYGVCACWYMLPYAGRSGLYADLSMACHAGIRPTAYNGPNELYSTLWIAQYLSANEDYRKKAESWWLYLFDKVHSPWKCIAKDLHLIEKDGKLVAFRITNLDKMPSQVILNFLVATRMPRENPGMIVAYHRYRNEAKFTRYESMFLCQHRQPMDLKSTIYIIPPGYSHNPFNAQISITPLKEKKPNYNPKITFRGSTVKGGYSLNSIWDGDSFDMHRHLSKCKLKDTGGDVNKYFFKKMVQKEIANAAANVRGQVDFAMLVAYLKETKEQWNPSVKKGKALKA